MMDHPHSYLLSALLLVALLSLSQAQAPQLTQLLRDSYTINLATTTEFNECRFTGNPPPTVEWTRNGQSLPTSEQDGVYYFPNNGSLILKRANSESSGTYVCTGSNVFGSTSATTELNISRRSGTPWYVMWYMWFVYALLLCPVLVVVLIALFFYRKKRAVKELPPPDPWIGN